MKTTVDTWSGKPFRWNTIALVRNNAGLYTRVPALCTKQLFIHLHPSRVKPELLAELAALGSGEK